MVGTTGTAFLGLTLGCARCHSHKFDPIAQREYYAMTALFAGVKHGERALPVPRGAEGAKSRSSTRASRNWSRSWRASSPKPARPNVATNTAGQGAAPAGQRAAATRKSFRPSKRSSFASPSSRPVRVEPCIDELEVWAGETQRRAWRPTARKPPPPARCPATRFTSWNTSTTARPATAVPGFPAKAAAAGCNWSFRRTERIERIVWGRDREGKFNDRVATKYRIEAARDDECVAARGQFRRPRAVQGQDARSRPARSIASRMCRVAEAEQGRQWLAELEQTPQAARRAREDADGLCRKLLAARPDASAASRRPDAEARAGRARHAGDLPVR